MDPGEASTSGRESNEEERRPAQDLFITHQISKLDTLAGLAVKYHVTVGDIKRANGLLSDTAMFAKDTLLIPTRSLPVGVEYETWAGMIVTKYGYLPGDTGRALSFGASASPPKHSGPMDMLQRYYGTGDTASEPSDFRPGDPEGYQGSANGTEIELSDMEHLGRLRERGARDSAECPGTAEYAGSRSGHLADERLRRRKAGELSAGSSPLRGCDAEGNPQGGSPERAGSGPEAGPSSNGRPAGSHRRAATQGGGASSGASRRETIMERLKRVASQPALAIPQAVSISRIGEAVIAPLAETLPPLPPGARSVRERAAAAGLITPRPRDKEAHKAE